MASTDQTDTPIVVQSIAQTGGDLILEIGKPVQTELRVSSATLSARSKVFETLLNGQFREGRSSRSVETPQTISLPEDNGDAMTDLCNLLHGQVSPELLRDVKAEPLLQLAIVVDKYACADSLRLQTQALLFNSVDFYREQIDTQSKFLPQIVAAAYLLDQPRFFEMATKRLAMESHMAAGHWPRKLPEKIIPATIFDATAHKSLMANWQIANALPAIINKFADGCCEEESRSQMYEVLGLAHDENWPHPQHNVVGLIKNVSKLSGCVLCGGAFRAGIEELSKTIEKECTGLCLGCVRDGNSLMRKCTREEHK